MSQSHNIPITKVTLGGVIIKMPMPDQIIDDINRIYDKNISKMEPYNNQLAGKIKKEHLITEYLTDEIKTVFKSTFEYYLQQDYH